MITSIIEGHSECGCSGASAPLPSSNIVDECVFDMMQAIIGNYAVPVLEEKQVWGTSDDTRTAYLDSQVVQPSSLTL